MAACALKAEPMEAKERQRVNAINNQPQSQNVQKTTLSETEKGKARDKAAKEFGDILSEFGDISSEFDI